MTGIFISHSSRDSARAFAIRDFLQSEGRYADFFLSGDRRQGIAPVGRWEPQLRDAIRTCDVLLALVSDNWLDSPWCILEWLMTSHKHQVAVEIGELDEERLKKDARRRSFLDAVRQNQILRWTELRNPRPAQDLLHLVNRVARAGPAWDPHKGVPPLPGLEHMTAAHAAVIGGRDRAAREAAALLQTCREDGRRVLVVHGDSGVGKSSFLHASLLHEMMKDHQVWLPVVPTRVDAGPPSEALAAALAETLGMAGLHRPDRAKLRPVERRMTEALEAGDAGAAAGHLLELARRLRALLDRPRARVLLMIDQAEGLLGAGRRNGAAAHESFLRMLAEAVARQGHEALLFLAFALRGDFLDEFSSHGAVLATIGDHAAGLDFATLYLPPLTGRDLQDAIRRPMQALRREIAPDLVAALLQDVAGPGVAPLLGWLLQRLDAVADGGDLTIRHYDDIGRLGSLSNWAEGIIQPHRKRDPALVDQLGRFLTGSLLDMRNPDRWIGASASIEPLDDRLRALVLELVDRRLLVCTRKDGVRVVRLAHDALVEHWGTLKAWAEEEREGIARRDRILRAFRDWRENGEPKDRLLGRVPDIQDARWLLRQRPDLLGDAGEEFRLFARLSREVRLEPRILARRLEREEKRARALRQVAEANLLLGGGNAREALRELRFAAKRWRTDAELAGELRPTLLRALLAPLRLGPAAPPRMRSDAGPVWAMALHPDGGWLLNGTGVGVVQMRRVGPDGALGEARRFVAHDRKHTVCDIVFSSDGACFATAARDSSREGSVAIWRFCGGRRPELLWRSRPIRLLAVGIALSAGPEGLFVAYGADDRPVIDGPDAALHAADLPALGARLIAVKLFPSRPGQAGRLLLGTGKEGRAALWDLSEKRQVWSVALPGGEDLIVPSVSPDGRHAVVPDAGGGVHLYDFTLLQAPTSRDLKGHQAHVSMGVFSADGSLVATAGSDRLVGIWTKDNGKAVHMLRLPDAADSLVFSSDGQHLFVGTAPGRVEAIRLPFASHHLGQIGGSPVLAVDCVPQGYGIAWGTEAGALSIRMPGMEPARISTFAKAVPCCRFDPEGIALVVAADDGCVRLFDPRHADGRPLERWLGASVADLAWWPERGCILAAGLDGTLTVLDAATLEVRAQYAVEEAAGAGGGLMRLALDRAGNRLAAACWEGGVVLWPDARDLGGRPMRVIDAPSCGLAFQPGGGLLAGGLDGRLRMLPADAAAPVTWPDGHDLAVKEIAFSPDGHFALTAANSFTARIWDVATGRRLARLRGHEDWISGIRMRADGLGAVTGSRDGTVRSWALPFGRDSLAEMTARLDAMALEPIAADSVRASAAEPKTAPSAAIRRSATSLRDRFVSERGWMIHKLKAKDSTGRWAYYFVEVVPARESAFMAALKSEQSIDLEDYGRVIGSCYGEEPNDSLLMMLRERFGFDLPKPRRPRRRRSGDPPPDPVPA